MKRKNAIFYLFSWILSLLLATSGLAQGLDVCTEKCCETALKADEQNLVHPLPFHKEMPDVTLALCNLHSDIIDKLGLHVPLEKSREATPACCHLEKAGKRVQGVTSPTKSLRTDRSTVAGIYAVLSDADALNTHRNQAVADYIIHPRAAPVPLYLRNASFIC